MFHTVSARLREQCLAVAELAFHVVRQPLERHAGQFGHGFFSSSGRVGACSKIRPGWGTWIL